MNTAAWRSVRLRQGRVPGPQREVDHRLGVDGQHGTVSTIVPKVAMVTDPRMDVEWVVTEHGAVNLRGKSTKERADALISIAHPDHRAELTAAARKVTLI